MGGSGFCLLLDLDLDLELDRDRDLDLSRCLVWESGCVSVRVGHEFRSASSELNHFGGAGGGGGGETFNQKSTESCSTEALGWSPYSGSPLEMIAARARATRER